MGKAKLVLIAANTPPLRKSELECMFLTVSRNSCALWKPAAACVEGVAFCVTMGANISPDYAMLAKVSVHHYSGNNVRPIRIPIPRAALPYW